MLNELDRVKLALEKSGSAVYQWDVVSDTIHWTGDIQKLLAVSDNAKISSMENLATMVHKLDAERFITSLKNSLEGGGEYSRSYRLVLPDNRVVRITDRGTVYKPSRINKKIFLVGTITLSGQEANMVTSHLPPAQHSGKEIKGVVSDSDYFGDDFMRELNHAFHECKSHPNNSYLLKISIDNLPMMMSWYSLEFADRIMDALEIQISRLLRKGDVIKRIAVDQFGVILKNQSESEVELVVDRMLNKVQLYSNPSFEEPIHLRMSIGSVRFPVTAENAQDALNKSYLALSNAKNKSDQFWCSYSEAKKEHMDSKEQVAKLHYMHSAFKQDRIRLAFQPVVAAKTGKIESYECLLRVQEEDGRIVTAGPLIQIAEKLGAIDTVDQYVMERIIKELQDYPEAVLSFNVSNLTTDNPKWLKICTRMLQDHNIASRMTIEITETAAQRDLRQTAYFVAAVQALGCKVALDDFGAGYTSFKQLKSLSVDSVKIDGSFINGLADNSENLLFIKTLIQFNRSYGLQTVAECVETGEIAKILMDNEVDYMQGYYFGKPDINPPWHVKNKQAVASK